MFGHALCPVVTPPVHHQHRWSSKPFVHSGVSEALPLPPRMKKHGTRPSVRSSKKALGAETGPEMGMGSGVRMTVVSETL